MKKIIFSALAIGALTLTSCSSDDNTTSNVTAPATYKFERNGKTSVSYSGQTTRIAMAKELTGNLKTNTVTAEALVNMYNHEKGRDDFTDKELNDTDKVIRGKVAASADYFSANTAEGIVLKDRLQSYLTKQVTEIFPKWDNQASAGVAGKVTENDGKTVRYVNAKGLEYDQAFTKSLIGALMVDQILNNYLDTSVLDKGGVNTKANDNDILVEGENYTTMEHKWDEAFGYLYVTKQNAEVAELGIDSFLNKYLKRVNDDADFAGIADKIYNAFKLGRAAIVVKNYKVRDDQAKIIRAAISKVVAIRAVHYLKNGSNIITNADRETAFHDLSEGYGFVQSLRFTRDANGNPFFNQTEVDAMLAKLQEGNGFWTISTADLDKMAEDIAAKFDFTVEETVN